MVASQTSNPEVVGSIHGGSSTKNISLIYFPSYRLIPFARYLLGCKVHWLAVQNDYRQPLIVLSCWRPCKIIGTHGAIW